MEGMVFDRIEESRETAREAVRHVAVRNGDGKRVTAGALRRLVYEQQFRCALTGWELTPQTASVDHIVPLSKGGTHEMSNVHVVHATVNRAKGTLEEAEFVAMCVAVASRAGGSSGGAG